MRSLGITCLHVTAGMYSYLYTSSSALFHRFAFNLLALGTYDVFPLPRLHLVSTLLLPSPFFLNRPRGHGALHKV